MKKMINMGRDLIETGVRDAKSLTTDEFLEIIAKAIKDTADTDQESEFFCTYEPNGITTENITGEHIKRVLNGEFGTEEEPDDLYWLHCYINDFLDDDSIVGHGYGEVRNEDVKLVTIKEGLPGIIVKEGASEDDGTYSFAMFIYCDTEERLRVYTPIYGNFFNRDTMEVIGGGYDGEDDLFILKELGEEIPKGLNVRDKKLSPEKEQELKDKLHNLGELYKNIDSQSGRQVMEEFAEKFRESRDEFFGTDYPDKGEKGEDYSDGEEFEIFSSIEKLDSTTPQENAIIEAIASAINVI